MEPTARKRINTRAKGKRSVKRTRDWLEGQGYVVESLERTTRFRGRAGGKTHDVFGADLIARNEREILFVQVKSNPADFASGVRELEKGPWPRCDCVRRICVLWRTGRRTKDGPEVREAGA